MKRDQFFIEAGRLGLFGLLALLTGHLILKGKVDHSGSTCSTSTCRNCRLLKDCERPEAIKEKQDVRAREIHPQA